MSNSDNFYMIFCFREITIENDNFFEFILSNSYWCLIHTWSDKSGIAIFTWRVTCNYTYSRPSIWNIETFYFLITFLGRKFIWISIRLESCMSDLQWYSLTHFFKHCFKHFFKQTGCIRHHPYLTFVPSKTRKFTIFENGFFDFK